MEDKLVSQRYMSNLEDSPVKQSDLDQLRTNNGFLKMNMDVFNDNTVSPTKDERHFFAYPKTCGFAWNCFGQMVFFANEKYNFEALKNKPEKKRLYDWPDQYT